MTIIYYLVYTRYHNPLNQVVGSVCRYYDEDLMHWRNYDFRIADHISYIERNGIKITEIARQCKELVKKHNVQIIIPESHITGEHFL